MDLSAPIFVALAVAWVVYLVPKALRRHDEAARTRPIEGSSPRARILATRAPLPPVHATEATATLVPRVVRIRARRRAAAAAARRRRRILLVLVASNLVVGALTWRGYLLPWAPGVPGGITLAYLMLCRALVRRERRAWESELRGAMDAEPVAEAPAEVRSGDPEDTVGLSLEAVAVAVPTTDGGFLWDPLPVTLPTYVGKPVAARTVRTIDLCAPGVLSSGRDEADTRLVAEASAYDDAAGAETDAAAQRAVGS